MKAINWVAYRFIKEDGYGRFGINMVRALVAAGLQVTPGTTEAIAELPAWMQNLAGWNWGNTTIQCLPANMAMPLAGRSFIFSMTEDTGCPKDWPDKINTIAERLIVPCEQNVEAFQRRGVKCPIHVVHGGTNPEEFPVIEAPQNGRPYTFLCLADRLPRKGTEVVWSAFYKAFENNPDVRLIVKGRPSSMQWLNTFNFVDKRITFWKADVESMADVFAQVDCFVFPSFGEGWGMPPREAAMMGLPVIATRWSGLEVGIDEWAIPVNTFKMGESTLPHGSSQWALPDLDEVIAHMRWCYENQDAARMRGRKAAAWLRENQTWKHSAQQVMRLLEEHG